MPEWVHWATDEGAERELAERARLVPHSCPTCCAELTTDDHESWCPEK